MLAGVTAMMLVLAGMEWKYLLAGVCAALPVLAALLFMVAWRRERMLVFLHPERRCREGAGFHIYQSLIAVGSGGLTGRGYMEGMQKLFYLPEAPTDFIFANIAEELGFIGAIVDRAAVCGLGVRGLRAAFRSQDSFARLVAFGITTPSCCRPFSTSAWCCRWCLPRAFRCR